MLSWTLCTPTRYGSVCTIYTHLHTELLARSAINFVFFDKKKKNTYLLTAREIREFDYKKPFTSADLFRDEKKEKKPNRNGFGCTTVCERSPRVLALSALSFCESLSEVFVFGNIYKAETDLTRAVMKPWTWFVYCSKRVENRTSRVNDDTNIVGGRYGIRWRRRRPSTIPENRSTVRTWLIMGSQPCNRFHHDRIFFRFSQSN